MFMCLYFFLSQVNLCRGLKDAWADAYFRRAASHLQGKALLVENSYLKGSGLPDLCLAVQERTGCRQAWRCEPALLPGVLLSGVSPPVPSCPSALLPHAHTFPSPSRATLAATEPTIRQCAK